MYNKMFSPGYIILLFVSTLVIVSASRPNCYRTLYVHKSGKGNFSTIQSAIDSIPSKNSLWICIYIGPGVYKEQVKIPSEKPFIYLKGDEKKTTTIVWGNYGDVHTSGTFISLADNIVVKRITFQNSYNYPPNTVRVTQALAALIAGDKSSFYNCKFLGFQDTLLDARGRHYFKSCYIAGGVDFIFGAGQSIYEGCTISVIEGVIDNKLPGFITAQGRASPNDTNGFVFKKCKIVGPRLAYLGRAWGQYARVIYYNSSFEATIVPQGWDSFVSTGHENRITFAEEGCYGKGSNTTSRVKWEKKLSPKELKYFTSITYIDNEGWLNKQPN